jgi:hypothetical protein
MSSMFSLDQTSIRDLRPECCDQDGRLRVMPAEFYQRTDRDERGLLGFQIGAYVLPTNELVDYLREKIGDRSAIEIGSGNGVLAQALGIRATDNRQMERPDVRATYVATGQPVTPYGDNVEALDALSAVRRYRPQVVVAAWVTHLYDPLRHLLGGNMFGVDERALLEEVEEYVFIGNMKVHNTKPLFYQHNAAVYLAPFVYSRSMNGSPDFIASWKGGKA